MPDPVADRASVETRLVELVLERYELGRTDSMTFAVSKTGPMVALPLTRGGEFTRQVVKAFFRAYSQAIGPRVVDSVLPLLQAEASDGTPRELSLRVHQRGRRVLVDLASSDGSVVVVTPEGWKVKKPKRPYFYRSSLTAAMPPPVKGGDIEDLREFIAVSDECWPMFVGWLAAALSPNFAQPIAYFTGPPGSGKTTSARHAGMLIDPLTVTDWQRPTSARGWTSAAAAVYLMPLDNITTIDARFADQLCRTVTGAGDVENELYTNSHLHATGYRRVVTLTTVTGSNYLRSDLASRVMRVELEPIERRVSEAKLRRQFMKARPAIFGALLDLLAEVHGCIDATPAVEDVRMADFGRFLAAVDKVRGTDGLTVYRSSRRRQAEEVIHGDSFLNEVYAFAVEATSWSGSASKLLKEVGLLADRGRHWPDSPQKVSNILGSHAEDFALLGIGVERGRDRNSRWISLDAFNE